VHDVIDRHNNNVRSGKLRPYCS